jgi:hypothetical protein
VRAIIVTVLLAAPVYGEVPVLWDPPSGWPPTLRDVASRLPRNTSAADPDLITYTHEANHFLCKGKPGFHGVYVGSGRRWEIPTPPLVTEEVFARIPEARRGTVYLTYLTQGQHEYWHRQPLMILDEWRAYTVGSRARAEMRMTKRAETVRHMATFAGYAEVLYRLAKELEGYDVTELREFCRWNMEECRAIVPRWDEVCDARFD